MPCFLLISLLVAAARAQPTPRVVHGGTCASATRRLLRAPACSLPARFAEVRVPVFDGPAAGALVAVERCDGRARSAGSTALADPRAPVTERPGAVGGARADAEGRFALRAWPAQSVRPAWHATRTAVECATVSATASGFIGGVRVDCKGRSGPVLLLPGHALVRASVGDVTCTERRRAGDADDGLGLRVAVTEYVRSAGPAALAPLLGLLCLAVSFCWPCGGRLPKKVCRLATRDECARKFDDLVTRLPPVRGHGSGAGNVVFALLRPGGNRCEAGVLVPRTVTGFVGPRA